MKYNEFLSLMEEHFSLNDKTIKRFMHSLSVVDMALRINESLKLGLDEEELKIASILHDYAKVYSTEEQIKMYEKINPSDLEALKSPNTIHAYLAPILLKEKYLDLSDNILNGIKYHTTAKPQMSVFEKVIYLADVTEDTRDYKDLKYYQNLALKDLDQAMLEVLDYTIRNLKKRKLYIHQNTIKAYEYYMKQKLVDPILNKVKTYLRTTLLTNVICYETKDISPFFDYALIATANNERLAKATIEHLKDIMEENDIDVIGYTKENSTWYLIDINNVIVHIFVKEERLKYNLDGIYYDLKKEVIE